MALFSRDHSVASSATIGRTPAPGEASTPTLPANTITNSEDVCMVDAEDITAKCPTGRRFIIAVDYGTTNSSASYAIVDDDTQALHREHVHSIVNFHEDPLYDPSQAPRLRHHSNEVPSEVWYPNEDITDAIPFSDRSEEPHQNDNDESGTAARDNEGDGKKSKVYRRDVPDFTRWGFEARPSMQNSNASEFLSKRNTPVKWAKLQLAYDPLEAGYPVETRKSYHVLRRHGIVRKELDFITDFLTCFFKHIKKELQKRHGLEDNEPVEMVLCVPVLWSCKGRRDMYAAVSVAMRNAGLGVGSSGHAKDLFDISEPEAAAAYVLDGEFAISPGENFVLLDAGGGTVDAITYTVTQTQPLRLQREAAEPRGGLCGSTYLNRDFRAFVKRRLEDETYLTEGQDFTLDDLIEQRVMKDFETRVKRTMSFDPESKANRFVFDIPLLKPNREKRFYKWKFPVNETEFYEIFEPRMKQVAALMEKQIAKCTTADPKVDVHKVILIGGYGDNPALQDYLKARLREISTINGHEIDLKLSPEFGHSATAVSAGAVLRAYNKEEGPERKLQSSYGLSRKEYLNKEWEGHKKADVVRDKLEAAMIVRDTILWPFKQGEIVDARPKREVMGTEWLFPLNAKKCVVKEEFFVSDTLSEDHYQRTSPKNRGKWETLGTFELDLTEWRDNGLMELRKPVEESQGEEHHAIVFDIVMELVGRSIRCSARYPSSGPEGERTGIADGEIIPDSEVQISITAAFEPGTK